MSPQGLNRGGRVWRLLMPLMGLLFVALSATPALAIGADGWSVEPSGEPDIEVVPRGAFFYELAPGQTVTDWISISNHSSTESMTFILYGADAFNLDDGTWALTALDDTATGVGAWIDLGVQTVEVAPEKELRLKFTITAPPDAAPGDYAGGVVAVSQQIEGLDAEGSIGLQRAIGARVYARVTGPVRPALAVVGLETTTLDRLSPDGGDLEISYTIRNVGNTRLSPTVVVSADSFSGESYFVTEQAEVQDLLPGEEATLSYLWSDLPWLDIASVSVVANHDRIVAAASTDVVLVSPLLVLALAGIAIACALFVARRRRIRREIRSTSIDVKLVDVS